jgi:hypothetical protein
MKARRPGVAVVPVPVRVLIEEPTADGRRLAVVVAVDKPSLSGGARVYSIADGRAR